MPETIMLTDIPGGLSRVEQGLRRRTSPDIREGTNTQGDDRQQRPNPLGLPVTGYRLFTTGWIVGLGIPKAIYSNRGQSLISPTLDWVGGIILSLLSFWLGAIESSRPGLCPRFFEVDLAPCILKFLRRHYVFLWFASVLPLLLAAKGMSFVEYAKRQDPKYASSSEAVAQFSKDDHTQFVLGVFMAVFLFCLHGLKVLWPKGFEGSGRYAFLIFDPMIRAHMLFLSGAIAFRTIANDSAIAQVIIPVTLRLYVWMMPWAVLPIPERPYREEPSSWHSRLKQHWPQYNVIWATGMVMIEVTMMFSLEWAQIP